MIKGDNNLKYSYKHIYIRYEFWFYFIPLYNSFVTNVLVYPYSQNMCKNDTSFLSLVRLFFVRKDIKFLKKM